MQAHTARSEGEQDGEVAERQRLRLEDGLEGREVDEEELDHERDGDGRKEHPVDVAAEEGDVEASVLKGRGEVEEDEGGEGLRRE